MRAGPRRRVATGSAASRRACCSSLNGMSRTQTLTVDFATPSAVAIEPSDCPSRRSTRARERRSGFARGRSACHERMSAPRSDATTIACSEQPAHGVPDRCFPHAGRQPAPLVHATPERCFAPTACSARQSGDRWAGALCRCRRFRRPHRPTDRLGRESYAGVASLFASFSKGADGAGIRRHAAGFDSLLGTGNAITHPQGATSSGEP